MDTCPCLFLDKIIGMVNVNSRQTIADSANYLLIIQVLAPCMLFISDGNLEIGVQLFSDIYIYLLKGICLDREQSQI